MSDQALKNPRPTCGTDQRQDQSNVMATRLPLGASGVAMATRALVECAPTVGKRTLRALYWAFAIMTGKTLGCRLMILECDESLFASEKQRFPRMCKIGVAIIAAEAFRGMGLMVENHPPPRTTSIEDQRNVTCCLHLPRRQKRPKEHNQSGHESRQEGDLGLHDSPPLRVENTVVDLGNA